MEEQQRVLNTVHRLLVRKNSWPTWAMLDAELDRIERLDDPWAAVAAVDRGLLWGVGDFEPQDGQLVGLSIAGLSHCPAASEDVAIFIDSVRLAAEMTRQEVLPDELALTPDLLEQHLRLPAAGRDDLLTRQGAIWFTAGSLWTSMSGEPASRGWTVQLSRRQMRRLRGVVDVDDFLRILATPTSAVGLRSNAAMSAPAPVTGPLTSTDVLLGNSGRRYTFYLDEHLGEGGQGAVFAGDEDAGGPVAVKRIPLRGFDFNKWYRDGRYAEREEQVSRYLEERRSTHVLPLLDTCIREDAYFLVYPRAERSLQELIDQTAPTARADDSAGNANRSAGSSDFPTEHLSPADVRGIAVELATGLAELHELGVLHRDVKPSNALYYQNRWMWGDLGAARVTAVVTATFTQDRPGTAAYRAPEVTIGDAATERSDVYSLGCTIYELATGTLPFERDDLARKHREAAPDLAAVGDSDLRYALMCMLSKQPGSRPTAQWVVDFLGNAQQGAPDDGLQRLGAVAQQRAAARVASETSVGRRQSASEAALAQFDQLWLQLLRHVERVIPEAVTDRQPHLWFLTVGDLQLMARIAAPADGRCSAVQLGILTVRTHDPQQSRDVANLLAIQEPDGMPQWRLLRMVRNDLAIAKVPVSESLSDGLGAVSLPHLEDHLAQREQRLAATSATARHETELTVELLSDLFAAEATAMQDEIGT